MTRRFSPTADVTLAYSSEILALDAATVLGLRTSRRIARRIPRGAPVARIETIIALRAFFRRLGRAIPTVITGSGQW